MDKRCKRKVGEKKVSKENLEKVELIEQVITSVREYSAHYTALYFHIIH